MPYHRVTLQFFKTDAGLKGQNVLYFHSADPAPTDSEIGAEIDNNWWQYLRPVVSNTIRLEMIYIKRIIDAAPPGETPYSPAMTLGSNGFQPLHVVLGPVYRFYDGLSGKKHRGRMYPYGVGSNHLSASGPQASMITAFNTWKGLVMGRYGPGGSSLLSLQLFHRNDAPAPTFSAVTDIRLAPRLGVQRRRNYDVGM